MPEITRRVRIGKIFTFSIDEKDFSKLENRSGMITSRNIKGMSRSCSRDVAATQGLEQHRALVLVVYCCTLVVIQVACTVERDGE